MNQVYFEKWTELTKKVQQPFQTMAELNLKMLQSLSYLKPKDLVSIKKPEEYFEKQLKLSVENGHKVLDHMQKSFQIIEGSVRSMLEDVNSADLNNTEFQESIKEVRNKGKQKGN